MSSPHEDESSCAFGRTEWSNYSKYRPVYPPSLIQILRSHHQQYCDRYNLAHDVASGSGVFVPVLVQDLGFQHVHVSDASETNVRASRELLGTWLAGQRQGTDTSKTLTFSSTLGEEMHACAAARSVDLVTVMEAAHWMDGPRLMASAAETLAPNGTLAIVTYCAPAHIKHNARAREAFQKAVGGILRVSLEKRQASDPVGAGRVERGFQQGCVGLDYLAADRTVWKNVRRIRIRGGGKGEFPNDACCISRECFAPSNVCPDERYDRYEEQDDEASGWELEVDRDWFYGYLTSFENPDRVAEMAEYKTFAGVFAEEFPAGNVSIEWTTDIFLASRRD